MSGLMMGGAVVALAGVLAIAIPVFTTERTKDVANIGDLKITATQETSYAVPKFAGPAALVVGLAMIGAAVATKRRS